MRFLLLTQYFPPEVGAAQTRLAGICRELVKNGHQVEIVTSMPNYPTGKIFPGYQGKIYCQERWEGLIVRRFWCFPSQGKTWARLLNYLSFSFFVFLGVLVCRRPEVVFVNSGPLFLACPGWFFSKVWRAKFIFNVSDLWPRSVEHVGGLGGKIFVKLAGILESWAYRQADIINAVTEGIREILINEKSVPAEKILFLPNGVDVSLFSPERGSEMENGGDLKTSLNLQGKFVAVYPGNHGYAHALDKVLQAASLLQDTDPTMHFLFVGGGSEKPKLFEMAQQLKLRNVTFVDPVSPEKLVYYIGLADVGLIHVRNSPLAMETRPAKMFPLMAMGKPILYAGFGEGTKIIERIGGGKIVESENPEALKDALLDMKSTKEDLVRMGIRNRQYVVNEMSFSRIVRDWLDSLGHLIKSKKLDL